MTQQTITRILVGVDEQDAADHAVRAGVLLAGALEARLDLLHAAPMEVPRWVANVVGSSSLVTEELILAARTSRVAHLSPILEQERHGSADELLTVVTGKPASVILDHAENNGIDLIVLGGHRSRGVLHFGSTARTVLGRSKCPVWVQSEPVETIDRIMAAIDMSPNSHLTLEMARELASQLRASVTVFHSFVAPYFSYADPPLDLDLGPTYGFEEFKTAEREHFEKTVAEFDWRDVKVETMFSEGNPVQAILKSEDSVDLIVMGTHGRTGLARAILGSQAYGVIQGSSRPVLAVPNPERPYAASENPGE